MTSPLIRNRIAQFTFSPRANTVSSLSGHTFATVSGTVGVANPNSTTYAVPSTAGGPIEHHHIEAAKLKEVYFPPVPTRQHGM